MSNKERFDNLLHKQGYASLYAFCKDNNLDYGNMNRRVNGVTQKIEIAFAFKIADILRVPIDTLLDIFYPEEMKKNRAAIKDWTRRNNKWELLFLSRILEELNLEE